MEETSKEKESAEIVDTGSVTDGENGMDLRVHDSSLDYKGRVPLRASTGSWKASFFIIGKRLLLVINSCMRRPFYRSIFVQSEIHNAFFLLLCINSA